MLCILGPTASGKSSLAMQLAQGEPRIELISMDSALVYRGMDIGTAKPNREEQARVRHHLIDLIDPTQSYSAARFVEDAARAAQEIRGRGHIPVMVGGTMLYYKAYREGLDELPSVPQSIRDEIAQEAAAQGWPRLHAQLMAIDPATATRLQPADAQRISRALELYRFTGKAMSELIAGSAKRARHDDGSREALRVVALEPADRALLHDRIAQRFKQMISAGLLDEVQELMNRGDLSPTLPSMRCVGYRQAWEYLQGRCTKEEFIAAGIAATRQLAKRQITWIRSFDDLIRLDPFASSATQDLLAKCRALIE